MLVDSNLLPHDALNVDLVRVVLILNQSRLDGFLQAHRVNWQTFVRNQHVNFIFLCTGFFSFLMVIAILIEFREGLVLISPKMIFRSFFSQFPFNLRGFSIWVLFDFHVISFLDDLTMGARCRETMNILVELVTEHDRFLTEEGLSAHNLHRHDRVQLTLKLLFGAVVVLASDLGFKRYVVSDSGALHLLHRSSHLVLFVKTDHFNIVLGACSMDDIFCLGAVFSFSTLKVR